MTTTTNDRMVIIVRGKRVLLTPDQTRRRRELIRDAVKDTVERYRPALERLESA